MRKIIIHRPGGHDRLKIEQHPTPEPGPGEVLIEVEAIGVNYADCMVRMGLYKSARDHVGWPVCPGFEIAGAASHRATERLDFPWVRSTCRTRRRSRTDALSMARPLPSTFCSVVRSRR